MAEMQREAHLTGKDLMDMVQLTPDDVGKYALVPGPRERADAIVSKLENPIKNFSFMEYTMHTGDFAGTKVTTINGGRFAADTSITLNGRIIAAMSPANKIVFAFLYVINIIILEYYLKRIIVD